MRTMGFQVPRRLLRVDVGASGGSDRDRKRGQEICAIVSGSLFITGPKAFQDPSISRKSGGS